MSLSFLPRPARSSLLSLLPRSTCLSCSRRFVRKIASEALKSSKEPLTRCVLIKNLPPTFTVAKLLSLKGFGRPIESVIRRPSSNEVEICYLQPAGAACVVRAAKKGDFVMDGQKLKVEFCRPRPLPVEIIAAVSLRPASRRLLLRLPKCFRTEKALEEEMQRFGEMEQMWMAEDGKKATVTFSDIATALKAGKTLRSEKAWADSNVTFYVQYKHIYPRDPQVYPHTVCLSHLDLAPYQLLSGLKDVLDWKMGEPLVCCSMNKNSAFLKFRDWDAAKIFYDTYNPPGRIQKSWANDETPILSNQVTAAILGASRTLSISNLDIQRIWSGRLREDFGKFGDVIRTFVELEHRRAVVEFADIMHACKAIDHIYNNGSDFSVYAGSKIGFWHRPRSGVTPPVFYLRPMEIGGSTSQLVSKSNMSVESEVSYS
ncbi:hypothetical protein D9758_005806 [Tetrapyrgos nigripes]|uniref:RRM domain-containing protein n=1 Tax=Tetrapyrgos nigripes TaxID=182062 RepID=A0A8H5GK81_9AGAR|nr:hypothetical protein D9758_005806 [Tetrapyrgos nigripes]